MQIDLVRASDATPETRAVLRALTAAVYPPDGDAVSPVGEVTWALAQWHALIREAHGAVVSHIGILLRDGELNGAAVRIGGIGGVKTHPAHRGHGYAAAGILRAARFFAAQGDVAFALLVCSEHMKAFYARLGWMPFAGALLVDQPRGIIPFTINETMVLPVRDAAPETSTIYLCGQPW